MELYVSRLGSDALADVAVRARAAAEELSREGADVSYVRSIYVAEDETCFHVYDAADAEVVAEVSRRAGAAFTRVARATEMD